MPRMSDLEKADFIKQCVADGERIIKEIAHQASIEKGWYFELNPVGVTVRRIKDDGSPKDLSFDLIARKTMVALAKNAPISVNINVDGMAYVSPFNRAPNRDVSFGITELNRGLYRRHHLQKRSIRRMAIAWEYGNSSDELEYACLTTIFLDGTSHRRYLSQDVLEFLFFSGNLHYSIKDVATDHSAVTVAQESIDLYAEILERIKRELISSFETKVLSNDAN